MLAIGIDQSLQSTGLCLINKDREILASAVVQTGKTRGLNRLIQIIKALDDFLFTNISDTGSVLFIREGYSYGSHTNSAYEIGELGGIINLHLFGRFNQMSDKVSSGMFIFSPSSVKKYMLGNGAVKKDSGYLLKVMQKTGKEFDNDNIADAFLLANMGFDVVELIAGEKKVSDLTNSQKEALISPRIKKSKGVTAAKFNKMSDEEVYSLIQETLDSDGVKVFTICDAQE